MDWKGIVAVIGIMTGVFWLYSDRHNDSRYLKLGDYWKDQLALKQDRDELKESLKEIQTDIKTLLREKKP